MPFLDLEQRWNSKQILVALVYTSLLLDNILLTVVVPIIPDYLYSTETQERTIASQKEVKNSSLNESIKPHPVLSSNVSAHEDKAVSRVFCSNESKFQRTFLTQPDVRKTVKQKAVNIQILTNNNDINSKNCSACNKMVANVTEEFANPRYSRYASKSSKQTTLGQSKQDSKTKSPSSKNTTADDLTTVTNSTRINGYNNYSDSNQQVLEAIYVPHFGISDENGRVGMLLSSKALVQLVMNPLVGSLTGHTGYHLPLFLGSINLLVASLLFAFGEQFSSLLLARSLQGIASACIGVSGMCLVADQYQDDATRSRVMGIVLGSIALGVLIGYPFGGLLYDFVGKMAPFIIISVLVFLNGVLQLFFLDLKPVHDYRGGSFLTMSLPDVHNFMRQISISIIKVLLCTIMQMLISTSWQQLASDGHVLLIAGAICLSTSTMAILEPCLPIWLLENLKPQKWQLGMVFIPDSLGYLIGTNFFGSIAYRLGRWRVAVAAMMIVGLSSVLLPSARAVSQLAIPHFGLGLGIGVVDAALVPLLASLMDSRYAAHYGSVYALQQMAVSLAYSLGPLAGGELVRAIGFPWLMRSVGLLNILYCPLLIFISHDIVTTMSNSLMAGTPTVNYKSSTVCEISTSSSKNLYRRFLNSEDSD